MIREIEFLNLPKLPIDVKTDLLDHYQQIFIDLSKIKWMNRFHEHSISIAAQEAGNENTKMPKKLREKILSIYQPFFSDPIDIFTTRTKNLLNVASCTPPHCDRLRKLAINYIVRTGGNAVNLTLYNENRKNNDLTAAENCKYSEVTIKNSVVLPEERWHCYGVQRFHSVENIETERYLLSILLMNNPDFEEFTKNYRHLIIDNTM